MRVTIRGQKPFDIPVHVSLLTIEFDPVSQLVSGNSKESKEARRVTAEWLSIAEDIFNRYEIIEKRIPDNDEVKSPFLDTIGRIDIEDSLVVSPSKAWNDYLNECSKFRSWRNVTILWMEFVMNSFLESSKVKDIKGMVVNCFQNCIFAIPFIGLFSKIKILCFDYRPNVKTVMKTISTIVEIMF